MYVARIIGTDVSVNAESLIVAYNLIMSGNKLNRKVSVKRISK